MSVRSGALAAVAVTVAVTAGLLFYVVRYEGPPPIAVSPTPTAAASPTPTTTATSQPSPSPIATAVATTRYVNTAMGYTLELRQPWRRATCGPSSSGPLEGEDGFDLFVTVPDSELQLGDVTFANTDHILVTARANPEDLSYRAWTQRYPRGGTERIEDATLSGRPALLGTDGTSETFLVSNAGYMYEIGHDVRQGTTGVADRAAIIRSFRFLTADELRAARAAATPTPAPRSVQTVADTLADGFAKKDVAILLRVASPSCLREGNAQAGLTSRDAQTFLRRLRDGFARGLSVEVRPRPIVTDRAFGQSIRATWREPGLPQHEVELVIVTERGTAFWEHIVHHR